MKAIKNSSRFDLAEAMGSDPITQLIRRQQAKESQRKPIVTKVGIHFLRISKHLRTVYVQLDGEIELADACTCTWDWEPFRVYLSSDCPIDQHRILALRKPAV